jgi:hypothetical protein
VGYDISALSRVKLKMFSHYYLWKIQNIIPVQDGNRY